MRNTQATKVATMFWGNVVVPVSGRHYLWLMISIDSVSRCGDGGAGAGAGPGDEQDSLSKQGSPSKQGSLSSKEGVNLPGWSFLVRLCLKKSPFFVKITLVMELQFTTKDGKNVINLSSHLWQLRTVYSWSNLSSKFPSQCYLSFKTRWLDFGMSSCVSCKYLFSDWLIKSCDWSDHKIINDIYV